jgi:peptidyl-prolyl cis-trans isomerase B (cyclophilin B)
MRLTKRAPLRSTSLAFLLAAALTACGTDSASTDESGGDAGSGGGSSAETVDCDYPEAPSAAQVEAAEAPPAQAEQRGEVPVTIATSEGDITGVLDSDAAPCTVNNAVSLAEQGFWEDTPCHRLTTEAAGIFVLQCGDPSGTGMGGPGYTIPDELSEDLTYPAGTIAMAKTAAPDSGGSQFFLVYEDTELPPEYTVFGQLDDEGLAVLRGIAEAGTEGGAPDGPPATPVTIESVTVD